MSLMDISKQATKIADEMEKYDVTRDHMIKLARLVAELASAASSATDPRLYGGG